MKYTIGDKVLLKQNKEFAQVVGIVDDEMVSVMQANQRFFAFVDELEAPQLSTFSSAKINAKKRSLSLDDFDNGAGGPMVGNANAHKSLSTGFHLVMSPSYLVEADGQEQIFKLRLYFINKTEYTINVKYQCGSNLGKEYSLGTTIYPHQHIYLHQVKFDLINEQLVFDFDINTLGKPTEQKQVQEQIKIKPKVLFQKLHALEQNKQAMIPTLILDDFPIIDLKRLQSKDVFLAPAKPASNYTFKKRPSKNQELDLHIEHLLSDYHNMSNAQKIEAQLQACEQAVWEAYQAQLPSIVIIHGIGEGKLKEEVHKLLKLMRKQVRQFENKYSQKYGFGATEVFLRY